MSATSAASSRPRARAAIRVLRSSPKTLRPRARTNAPICPGPHPISTTGSRTAPANASSSSRSWGFAPNSSRKRVSYFPATVSYDERTYSQATTTSCSQRPRARHRTTGTLWGRIGRCRMSKWSKPGSATKPSCGGYSSCTRTTSRNSTTATSTGTGRSDTPISTTTGPSPTGARSCSASPATGPGSRSVRVGSPHDMAEFFVMRKYRRHGIGIVAARELFARFPGDWQVRQLTANRGRDDLLAARHTRPVHRSLERARPRSALLRAGSSVRSWAWRTARSMWCCSIWAACSSSWRCRSDDGARRHRRRRRVVATLAHVPLGAHLRAGRLLRRRLRGRRDPRLGTVGRARRRSSTPSETGRSARFPAPTSSCSKSGGRADRVPEQHERVALGGELRALADPRRLRLPVLVVRARSRQARP